MSPQGLNLAPGLALPLDVAGEAIAILAKRGAGKTNTGRVLVEELVGADVQAVVLDPVGAWWGLRYGADRKTKGLALPILGGQHGDVPLEPTAGALIADVVVDTGQSLVVDLSDFPSKATVNRFVTDFAERLYRRKARAQSLLHLVLEEADEFAPQKGMADTARMRGAIEAIVRRGRSRGLGVTLITQRSAVLNKDVLTQADVLIVMRTTGPQDVKAIEQWIDVRGDDGADQVLASLPSLETGEAWIWNPERGLLERVRIRRSRTFDSGATPKAGERKTQPTAAAPIDLSALGEQIAATADRAKANDPAELRKQLRTLEKQLAERPAVERAEPEVVEVPVLNGHVDELIRALDAMRDVAGQLVAAGDSVRTSADAITAAIDRVNAAPQPARKAPVRATPQGRAATPPPAPAPAAVPARDDQGGDVDARVSGPQQKILDALALFASIGVQTPKRSPLAAVAGASPKSSGFEKNVSTLRTRGLIDYPAGGRVALTDAGEQAATWPEHELTDEHLQEAIYRMVSGPQAHLLRILVECYPEPLSRDELAERAAVSAASSGFEKNISTLRSFELIEYPERGYVAALPILFTNA